MQESSQIDGDWRKDNDVVICGNHFAVIQWPINEELYGGNWWVWRQRIFFWDVSGMLFACLLWIDDARAKDKTFIWVSICSLLWIDKARAKDKTYTWVSVLGNPKLSFSTVSSSSTRKRSLPSFGWSFYRSSCENTIWGDRPFQYQPHLPKLLDQQDRRDQRPTGEWEGDGA